MLNAKDQGFVELESVSNDTEMVLGEVAVDNDVMSTSGMSLSDALKPGVPDLDTNSFAGNVIDKDMKAAAQIYGNNIFALQVENTSIIGVLKELPTLSLESNWEPNVIADILESLGKLSETSTKLQMINSIFGVAQTPYIAGGASTTQMYTGCGESVFNLQFRIYSTESIGPVSKLTGYKRALAALCIYAPALHTYDPETMLSLSMVNLGKSAIALLQGLNGVVEYGNQKLAKATGSPNEAPSGPEADKTAAAVDNALKHMTDFGSAAGACCSAMFAGNEVGANENLKKSMDELGKMITEADKFLNDSKRVLPDKSRVESPLNYYQGMYGGAIWNLTILPGILKHKIPVYVKSWTAKPSKEIDNKGDAAYMDFTVTCVLDQTKTGTWWNEIIYAPEADLYKNVYKKTVKTPD